ncbi:unnamed protein product [Sphenostylis stenocarpa]|uniref:Uncharacterized protein n=1 Tax=Sphenostylis stenocarpa TaxID=92480 RepID=A0AA86VBS4_9FABA|nr:unnamed protein product [Sphenostylis stenocarpa]
MSLHETTRSYDMICAVPLHHPYTLISFFKVGWEGTNTLEEYRRDKKKEGSKQDYITHYLETWPQNHSKFSNDSTQAFVSRATRRQKPRNPSEKRKHHLFSACTM